MGREEDRNDNSTREHRTTQSEFINQLLHHDLTNHLLVVQGNVELLIDEAEDRRIKDRLRTIESQTEAAFSLLRETKLMMNGPRGSSLEFSTIGSAVEAEIGQLEAAYPEANINVESSGDVTATAHPFLGSILGNLLRNAIDHHHGPSPRVRVRVDIEDDILRLEVEDNGPGIPDEVLDGISTTGFRADDGMGLYIVHSLVDQYGGSISIDSDASGTAVTVVLPIPPGSGQDASPKQAQETRESVVLQQPIREHESPSLVAVRTVAAASDRRIEDLEPIARTIDTEALDSILEYGSTRVRFQ